MSSSNFEDRLISYELMSELVRNFETDNYEKINAGRATNLPDSKEYWYSLEVLEDYINYVKTEAAKKKYTNLGIKIKLAQYPENKLVGKLQSEKTRGYQTVCLVPTTETQGETNREIEDVSGLNFANMCPPECK
ncbi:MAG: hypothetical protein LBE36_08790 [Flavobacteriaceae bacterium]|jgi:hypothetical protein|nr:hypothetical protein [Flavobacteriaceae bacterium]